MDSQLLLLGRALREAEGAALEWQSKARRAEEARQDLGNMVSGSEKAVQQVCALLVTGLSSQRHRPQNVIWILLCHNWSSEGTSGLSWALIAVLP